MRPTMRGVVMAGAGGLLLALIVASAASRTPARAGEALVPGAPVFEVDPSWPRPLPNNWVMGQAAGVAVDRRDHVWVVQRGPAPRVMEFDRRGALVQGWGGPGAGHPWPDSEHGIHVDDRDHVWLAGNGPRDGMILEFTRAGTFVRTIGEPGVIGGDRDTRHLNRPAGLAVDPVTRELFVADGYGNHRVIVFDADTGRYRRHWGANGRAPGDATVKGFGNPVHCIRLSHDGLVYVCDRANNRIQVFRKDGTFVHELVVAPGTRGNGSTWDVDLSRDAAQRHLYTVDGENNRVWILLRESGRVVGAFGRRGRAAGQFRWVHNVAVDSAGNLYTTEVDAGQRAQKFVPKPR